MSTRSPAGALPVRGYPGRPLGPQVRPIEETLSAFQVIRDHFFPHSTPAKPGRLAAVTPSQTDRFA